ncbi:glycosyltransferase [Sphingomonas sp. LY160]|uniref:glycosyltransferase n=1 Tax=Sphingomonas sp. LY160 TaxID=3095342 RepID=UPI002ADEF5E6|nr:glycosyltransferase [Sphingomonas sp. LY160]MEA1071026.1 glycosyltransferase [Sphingomonas sp. LY160]
MTDPLGASQVLPYLAGLSALGHQITLISFEKPERGETERKAVRDECAKIGIDWHPLSYHRRPPIFSTVYDLMAMRRRADRLHRQKRFDLVHCRSYLSAMVGHAMQASLGVAFLFDMRGFWADERVEGRLWDLRKPMYRTVYDYFKRRERLFLGDAAAIVSLTEAGKQTMLARDDQAAANTPMVVIPCCVDFDLFMPPTSERRDRARVALAIEDDRKVFAYLGSIGTWYMLDEMLDCFAVELTRDPVSLLLFITRDDPALIRNAASAKGIPSVNLMIRAASREEVSLFLSAVDVGLFFIRPTFSKLASCPTKLGEFLAAGIPVLTNRNVGDVDTQVEESGAGALVDDFDVASYETALATIELLPSRPQEWRKIARKWFDLQTGIATYDAVYRSITDRKTSTRRGA